MDICPLSQEPCSCPKLIQIVEIKDGITNNLKVCNDCADNYLKNLQLQKLDQMSKLCGLIKELYGGSELQELPCDKCGMEWADFIKEGRLGCANCYKHFKEELHAVILKSQRGAVKHTGRRPKRSKPRTTEEKLISLNRKLKKAIAIENYEVASILKKKIDELMILPKSQDCEGQ